MRKFEPVMSRLLPLNRADVDTDQIIPAKYLKRIERSGFGKYLFDDWLTHRKLLMVCYLLLEMIISMEKYWS